MDFEKMASEAPSRAAEQQTEQRRQRAEYNAAERRRKRLRIREAACITRYDETRDRFMGLFRTLRVGDEHDTRARRRLDGRSRIHGDYYYAKTASTPDIVMAKITDDGWQGMIVAQVVAKLPAVGYTTGKYEGWRQSQEFEIKVRGVPDKTYAELTYESETFSRELLAEWNHGNPMSNGRPSVDAEKAEKRLDETLPAVNASLDHILRAAADPALNPELAERFERLSA